MWFLKVRYASISNIFFLDLTKMDLYHQGNYKLYLVATLIIYCQTLWRPDP